MGIEGGLNGIAGLVVGIVDEEPHPDPAIGRLHHAVDDDPAGRIAVPGIVLHVEASLGQVGQRETDDEGLAPVAQEAEAGQARMLLGRRTEKLAQPGRGGVLERRRYSAQMVGPVHGLSNPPRSACKRDNANPVNRQIEPRPSTTSQAQCGEKSGTRSVVFRVVVTSGKLPSSRPDRRGKGG